MSRDTRTALAKRQAAVPAPGQGSLLPPAHETIATDDLLDKHLPQAPAREWPPRDWPPKVGDTVVEAHAEGVKPLRAKVIGVVTDTDGEFIVVVSWWSPHKQCRRHEVITAVEWHVGTWDIKGGRNG